MRTSRRDLFRELTALARQQAGYFSARQAREIGYSHQAQKYHADNGNWEKVDRGIYRLPNWPVGAHDDFVLWSLWTKGKGVVSHDSAVSARDLGDINPARVHITVPRNFRPKNAAVVLHHEELPEQDVESGEGFRITTVTRAIIDVASAGLDTDQLGGIIRDALRQGQTTEQRLRQRAEEIDLRAALRIERILAEKVA